MADVFISYTSKDRPKVERIAKVLMRLGLDVWYDQQIQVGAQWRDEIQERLKSAKAVVTCWSPNAVQSSWVMWEAANAQLMDKLSPVMIEQVTVPQPLSYTEAALLQDWNGEGDHKEWQVILASLERLTGFPNLTKAELARAARERHQGSLTSAHFVSEKAVQSAKRILSLDAGGGRAMYTLAFLKRIEIELASRSTDPNSFRLSHYFDLIGGASLNAVVATMLALGRSVDEIKDFFLKASAEQDVGRPSSNPFFQRKRKTPGYRFSLALQEEFRDQTIEGAAWKTGVAITAKRVDTGSTWVIMNNPQSNFYDSMEGQTWLPNKKYKLSAVLAAGVAEPGTIIPRKIEISDGSQGFAAESGYFVDPATSSVVEPSLHLLTAAVRPEYGLVWEVVPENQLLISDWDRYLACKSWCSPTDWRHVLSLGPSTLWIQVVSTILIIMLSIFRAFAIRQMVGTSMQSSGIWTLRAPTLSPVGHCKRFDFILDAGAVRLLAHLENPSLKQVQDSLVRLQDSSDLSLDRIAEKFNIGMELSDGLVLKDQIQISYDHDLYSKAIEDQKKSRSDQIA